MAQLLSLVMRCHRDLAIRRLDIGGWVSCGAEHRRLKRAQLRMTGARTPVKPQMRTTGFARPPTDYLARPPGGQLLRLAGTSSSSGECSSFFLNFAIELLSCA